MELPSQCRSLPQSSYDNYLQIHLLVGVHGRALQDKMGSPGCGDGTSYWCGAGGGVGAATAPRGLSLFPPHHRGPWTSPCPHIVASVSPLCQHPAALASQRLVGTETPTQIPSHVTAQDWFPRCRCTSRHATPPHRIITISSCCEQLSSLSLKSAFKPDTHQVSWGKLRLLKRPRPAGLSWMP